MDNMAYLQQIASPIEQKPKSPIGSLMSGPLMKVLIGLALLAIVIIIIGTITSGSNNGNSERPLVEQIQLRSNNLIKTITTYNKQLKSSSLRSTGQSLSTVLSETNRELTAILKSDYSIDDSSSSASKSLKSDEDKYISAINTTLENARLNANLDRTYARQMALETSLLSSLESSLLAKTSNQSLKSILVTSLNNLSPLHDSFDNFTDSNI